MTFFSTTVLKSNLIRVLLFTHFFIPILANLIMLSHGCIIGWFSPALPKLLSANTPLVSGPLTVRTIKLNKVLTVIIFKYFQNVNIFIIVVGS